MENLAISAPEVANGQLIVADTATLFERQAELRRLFEAVGHPSPSVLQSLDATVAETQAWVGGDHSRPNHQFLFGQETAEELHAVYEELGLKRSYELPAGEYDQGLIMGGIHRGINRRMGELARQFRVGSGVVIHRAMLLGGERHAYPEKETPAIRLNFKQIKAAGIKDDWVRQMKKQPHETWWESDLLRLAATAKLGGLAYEGTNSDPDWDRAYPQRQEFTWKDMGVTIVHNPAVARKDGAPRPNTESTIVEWLRSPATKPPEGAVVAFFAANPHMDRMLKSARHMLFQNGRTDIELVPCGPGAPHDIGHSMYLGEIARSLYEDQRIAQRA